MTINSSLSKISVCLAKPSEHHSSLREDWIKLGQCKFCIVKGGVDFFIPKDLRNAVVLADRMVASLSTNEWYEKGKISHNENFIMWHLLDVF